MTYRAWICEGCKAGQRFCNNVWDCPGCGEEICDNCGWRYGHCRGCAVGKTDEQLRLAANATGSFDFEPEGTTAAPVPPKRPSRASLEEHIDALEAENARLMQELAALQRRNNEQAAEIVEFYRKDGGRWRYPHMCRDEHDEIGFKSDHELCPVCNANGQREAALTRAQEAEQQHAESLAAYGEVLGDLEAARAALAQAEKERDTERSRFAYYAERFET